MGLAYRSYFRINIIIGCLAACLTSVSAQEKIRPEFSPPPGFCASPLSLTLSGPPGMEIRYTTDGSEPDEKSTLYAGTLTFSQPVVVRARCYRGNLPIGETETGTFFPDPEMRYSIPDEKAHVSAPLFPSSPGTVSISCPPDSLFHPKLGIYPNFNSDRYINCHFEYFDEEGQRRIAQNTGIRIAGGSSRVFPKRSFKLEADAKKGFSPFRYDFFPGVDADEYGALFLRADATNGKGGDFGQNLAGERFHNEVMQLANREAGAHVTMAGWKPVRLFLNGKYWGLYTLQETKGAELIRRHHQVQEMTILEGTKPTVIRGKDAGWRKFMSTLNAMDPEDEGFYAFLQKEIDLLSFTDHWIFQFYAADFDAEENCRYWREDRADAKWKWIAFDFDAWGNSDDRLFTEMYEEEDAFGVFLIGRMLRNPAYRNLFLTRLCDLLSLPLSDAQMKRNMEAVLNGIRPELKKDRVRWEKEIKYMPEGSQEKSFLTFTRERPLNLMAEVKEQLRTGAPIQVEVSLPGAAEAQLIVNGLKAPGRTFSGTYFPGLPVEIQIVPETGWRVQGWEGGTPAEGNTLRLTTGSQDIRITCILEKVK